MKAIDTNILARALLNDDAKQSPIARQVLDEGVFVSLTVLLEMSWLLRSRYGFAPEAVAEYLSAIVEMPTVSVPEPSLVSWAIRRSAGRRALADLLHIVAATGASEFVTFDEGVARVAAPDSPMSIMIPA